MLSPEIATAYGLAMTRLSVHYRVCHCEERSDAAIPGETVYSAGG